MINRREFSMGLAGTAGVALGLAASMPAWAQGAPVEGTNYTKLGQPVPAAATGKVEVVEFFSYACPHCFAFDPLLEGWIKRLPADVSFRRTPVFFGRPAWEYLQSLYYALEVTNQLGAMHGKVFNAIHADHKNLAKDADVLALFSANGADGAKVVEAMKSFGVQTKVRQAKQLAEAYKIEGVPTLGVQGRWTTSSSQNGTHERALQVVDFLIAQARKSVS